MGFKLFVSIWLVFIALTPQEIQCLDSDNSPWDNCWTWTKWSDNAFDNWNTNSKVVSLNDTTKPFGMGCHVSNSYITHIGKSSVPEANCILTHTHQGLVGKSYTNCIKWNTLYRRQKNHVWKETLGNREVEVHLHGDISLSQEWGFGQVDNGSRSSGRRVWSYNFLRRFFTEEKWESNMML